MKISEHGLNLIKKWESCKLTSYPDTKGIPTIGWGTIRYKDSTPVKLGETITQELADELFANDVQETNDEVAKLVTAPVTQNQFDSLVVCTYNIGTNGFKKSTLLKLVNKNPNDPNITAAFLMWNKERVKDPKTGKFIMRVSKGLTNRRTDEAHNYYL